MSQVNTIIYPVKATDEASGVFAKIGNSLGGLNQQAKGAFGAQSGFGQLGLLLKGGGIAAGLVILSDQLGKAAEKVDELSVKFRQGEITGGEFAAGMVRSIPLIDRFIGGIESIALSILGYRRELEKANAEKEKFDAKAGAINAAQAATGGKLEDARNRALVGRTDGNQGNQIREQARQELEKNQKEVDALRSQAAKTPLGNTGKIKEDIDLLEKYYKELYGQARVKAADADQVERVKAFDDMRKKDEAEAKRREEEIKKAAKAAGEVARREQLRARFALEDKAESLGEQRDTLKDNIASLESRKPRTGATAAAMTDIGRSGVLASMERRSSDPGVAILKQSKSALDSIDKELKAIRNEAKQRQRMNQLGGGDEIF